MKLYPAVIRRTAVLLALLALVMLACACPGTATLPDQAPPPADPLNPPDNPGPSPTPPPMLPPTAAPPTAGPPPTKTPVPVPLARDFTLETFEGETYTLSDLRGRVVVINFWASWCPPCREELPTFERAWQTYREMEVVFLGIAVEDVVADAVDVLQSLGITYPNGLDPGNRISADYNAWALPTTVVVAQDGTIARTFMGTVTYNQLSDLLAELVTGP